MEIEQTVYIVDDEEPVRNALRFLAKSDGLKSESFGTAQAFLDSLEKIGPGCLLLDVFMPDMTGLELQEALRERKADIPVIILTGHADVATAVRAMKAGATDFVKKPFENLDAAIREALQTLKQKHLIPTIPFTILDRSLKHLLHFAPRLG